MTPLLQDSIFQPNLPNLDQAEEAGKDLLLYLMHEMSIAQSILDIILQESGNHKVTRVLSVALKVGELSAVETESLRFCFELLTKGTPAEGAQLDIERVQVTCRCQDCGSNFTVQELVFSCPSCQGVRVEMLSGRELSVESFEAE